MKIFSANGEDLPAGSPFILNDLAYPWNWFDLASEEDLKVHGITYRETDEPPPTIVTPRQARLALLEAGLLDNVQAAVTSADKATQITWDKATEISRKDPLISQIGSSLGLSEKQIDDLFRRAAQL